MKKLTIILLMMAAFVPSLYGQYYGHIGSISFFPTTDTTYVNKSTGMCYVYNGKYYVGDGTYLIELAYGGGVAGDYLKKDGSVALTAPWDAGAFRITADTLTGDTYGSDGSVSDAELLFINSLTGNVQDTLVAIRSDVGTVETTVSDHGDTLTAHLTRFNTVDDTTAAIRADIQTNTADISTNADSLSAHLSRFNTVDDTTAALRTDIQTNAAGIAENADSLAVHLTRFNTVDDTTGALRTDINQRALDADVLKKDGSVALTADWNAGSHRITAQSLAVDTAFVSAEIQITDGTDAIGINSSAITILTDNAGAAHNLASFADATQAKPVYIKSNGEIETAGNIKGATYASDGSVSDAELKYINTLSSNAQNQIDGKQATHTNLTGLSSLSSTGLVAKTGAGTFTERTLTGTADQITVTNGNGVSGNPTIAFVTNPILAGNLTVPNGGTVGAATNKWTFDDSNNDISTTAKVGIGEASNPQSILYIEQANDGGDTKVIIRNSDSPSTDETSTIRLQPGAVHSYDVAPGIQAYKLGTGAGTALRDYGLKLQVTNNDEVVNGITILNTGYVGVNITNPTDAKLVVAGDQGASGYIGLYADSSDDNADRWRFEAENGADFNLQSYASGSWVDKFSVTNTGDAIVANDLTVLGNIIGTTCYGEMGNEYGSSATEVLGDANWHAMCHANISGSAPHMNSGFTFVAGKSGTIASSSTDPGSTVTFTDVDHGLLAGDYITLNTMSDASYNGVYEVQSVTDDTFTINETNTEASETGTWQMGAYLLVGTSGVYKGTWSASFTQSLNNTQTTIVSPFVNTTQATKATSVHMLNNNSDTGGFSGNGNMSFTAGDRIWFAVQTSAAQTITFLVRNLSVR